MTNSTSTMPQLIFLGPPGSGKGTQANLLKQNYDYRHLSTGDLLRTEITNKTTLGLKVQSIMAQGNLVSDEIVIELLEGQCNLSHGKYIFDGFPRTSVQAQMLNTRVIKNAKCLAIEFKIQVDILVERIVNRRSCPTCSAIYNVIFRPPKDGINCDTCKVPLIHREDDKSEVVTKRIQVYQDNIRPVLDYYATLGILRQVDGMEAGERVFENIKKMFA